MNHRNSTGDDILVLWRWDEAEESEGYPYNGSVGSQLKHRSKGDRLFICATRDDELFLLGAIRVTKVMRERNRSDYRATGRCISGPFRIIPLAEQKWKLRFEGESDRLSKLTGIAWQVRTHRHLTPESAEMLLSIFSKVTEGAREANKDFERDGRLMRRILSVRERNPKVRHAALRKHGRKCMICGFDPATFYGEWARNCIETHHLHLVSIAPQEGQRTTLDDVIVVCPNCHRALHCLDNPAAWKRLKRAVQKRTIL